jgi:LmbE family N-acetylglucosaminyl deacetylase
VQKLLQEMVQVFKMGLTSIVLKFAVPVPKVEDFERYLFIGPHPDDIEIGAGATAAKLAAMGKKVCFLVCLDGRFGEGNTDLRGQDLIRKRKEESIKSAEMLGVKDVRFLDLKDGGGYEQKDLIEGIAKVAGEFGPDMILAPDPCVSSECHVDHLNVGTAARQIACFAAYPGIMAEYQADAAPVKALAYYMTAKPNRFVKTTGYVKLQIKSVFENHLSQFPKGCAEAASIQLYLKLRAVDFGIRSCKGCAEGFRVLGTTHMHCLPEAGK